MLVNRVKSLQVTREQEKLLKNTFKKLCQEVNEIWSMKANAGSLISNGFEASCFAVVKNRKPKYRVTLGNVKVAVSLQKTVEKSLFDGEGSFYFNIYEDCDKNARVECPFMEHDVESVSTLQFAYWFVERAMQRLL